MSIQVERPNQAWQQPAGWIESKAGIFTPAQYVATGWEIEAPAIRTPHDAAIDYAKCMKSAAYFVFMHVWTVDVDDPMGSSVRKMPAFPHLRRFLNAVQVPQNVLVEKSRQMLMSWIWMALFLWDILFHDNWPNLVISKRAKDVDDGGLNSTPDSNLGKLRFMYERLPYHLWQPFEIKAYKVRNVLRESHVTGETGVGGKASRGPTYRRALMDEAAYIDRSETVFKGVRQAAKTGTALNSTPNGKGNVFARIRHQQNTTFRKLTFHWSEHPRKAIAAYCDCNEWTADPKSTLLPHEQYAIHRKVCVLPDREKRIRSPWYDQSVKDMRVEDVASELDISYEKSQRGRVWSAYDAILHTFDHTLITHRVTGKRLGERRVTESEEGYRARYLRTVLDPHLPPIVGWDFGIDPSKTAMVFGQVVNEAAMRVRWIDAIADTNKSYKFYGQFFLDVWLSAWSDVGGTDFYDVQHYGDPAGAARASDLTSWITNLRSGFGINILKSGVKKGQTKLEWLDFINDIYRENRIEISTYATILTDAIEQYHFPLDENGEPIPGKVEPVQDEWSHPADAKRYPYQGRWPNRLRHREIQSATKLRDVMRNSGRGKTVEVQEW